MFCFWKVKPGNNGLGYLAEEISKPNVEGVAWFLPVAHSKMGEERNELAAQRCAKDMKPVACDPISHLSRMLSTWTQRGQTWGEMMGVCWTSRIPQAKNEPTVLFSCEHVLLQEKGRMTDPQSNSEDGRAAVAKAGLRGSGLQPAVMPLRLREPSGQGLLSQC